VRRLDCRGPELCRWVRSGGDLLDDCEKGV
jgi:hypothetical protein